MLVCAHFCHEIKDVNYKSHWNILIFCDQRKMMPDLNMSHEKMSDFVSFSLLGSSLAIQLRNFDFFYQKKAWCQIWICPVKPCPIWFKLHCLSRILAVSWEIRISNFIEIVWYVLIKKSVVRSKFCPVFYLTCIFWHYYRNNFELKKVSNDFKMYWNTLLKMLYLKGYNQRIRNDFFGYRRY